MTRTTYNFIRGMGSVLDLLPSGSQSRVGQGIDLDRSDSEALRQDFERLSQDFQPAVSETAKECGKYVESKQAK